MSKVYSVFISHSWNNIDDLINLRNLLNNRGYFNVEFKENINNLDLANISIPGKWAKAEQFIGSMSLYNFIMGKEIFSLGSAGNFIYCMFRNPKLFQKSNLDMTKIKGITIPQVYDKLLLDKKLSEFQIQIDANTQWDTLFSTTVGRIVELVKLTKE